MSHSANKSVPSQFLDGLSGEDLRAILRAAQERRLSANTVVVNQGDPAEHFFLLTHGHARHFFNTENGQKILLRWLVPGDVTGAVSLLSKPGQYQMGTEVVEDSRFLVWDRVSLGRLTTRYPRLLQNVLFIAQVYFDWYLTAHIALTCESARQRCASVLTNIAHAIGHKVAGGTELAITNEELASAAAVNVFDASRFLSEWRHSGAVAKARGKVIVRSPELLSVSRQRNGTG